MNFEYLTEMLRQYGFEPEVKMPGTEYPGIGNFQMLYESMMKRGGGFLMSETEKEISFLNKYFVFKKIRKVDSGLVHQNREPEPIYGQIGRAIRLHKSIRLTQ